MIWRTYPFIKIWSLALLTGVYSFAQANTAKMVSYSRSKKFQMLSGQKQENNPKLLWDKKYNAEHYVFGKAPAEFLSENYQFIPEGGRVLDVGMGEGRNAVFLAQKGFRVTGVDISSVAVRKANALAKEFGVRIETVVASMEEYPAKPNSFDAIICYYYVDRELVEKFKKWLRPGGVIIYEAHTLNQKRIKGFERYRDDYLLKPGELLTMFDKYKILKFEEPLHLPEYRSSVIVKKL